MFHGFNNQLRSTLCWQRVGQREKREKEMASTSAEEEKSHPIESAKDADGDMVFNKLMYDRDIPGYNPRDLEYCKPLADLAIECYNKQHSTNYHVVELIRVIGCVCFGFYFCLKFTVSVADSDSDAITFGAEVNNGIKEMTVEYVVIVIKGVTLNVDPLHARYHNFAGYQ